jgi:hypothetical protein
MLSSSEAQLDSLDECGDPWTVEWAALPTAESWVWLGLGKCSWTLDGSSSSIDLSSEALFLSSVSEVYGRLYVPARGTTTNFGNVTVLTSTRVEALLAGVDPRELPSPENSS